MPYQSPPRVLVARHDEVSLGIVELGPRLVRGNPQSLAGGEQILLERASHLASGTARSRRPRARREGSGTTRARSIACTRPKPWQVSQAPSGELNEKRAGSGAGKRRPQPSHAKPSRKRARSPFSTTTITSPSLRANAVATASTRRARSASPRSARRSTSTSHSSRRLAKSRAETSSRSATRPAPSSSRDQPSASRRSRSAVAGAALRRRQRRGDRDALAVEAREDALRHRLGVTALRRAPRTRGSASRRSSRRAVAAGRAPRSRYRPSSARW